MTTHPGIKQRPVQLDPEHLTGGPLDGLFTHPFFRLLDANQTECKGCGDLFDDYDRNALPARERDFMDDRRDQARAMCRRCPIWFGCLEYAIETDQFGLWAGTDDAQRAKVRAAVAASSNKVGATA